MPRHSHPYGKLEADYRVRTQHPAEASGSRPVGANF